MHTRARVAASAALILSQLLPAIPAGAAFSDVPSSYMYAAEIDALAAKGIIKGNPDNSYKPEKTINRAELLTLLYRATGKNPGKPSKACFKDSGTGEWFSPVVCDAAKNKYVGGYPDGNFRPGQDVNRVEALKMIHTVFGFSLRTGFDVPFTDLPADAWYTPYVISGVEREIIPLNPPSTKYYPDRALTKGEAAAYVFNALGLEVRASSSSSSATARSSSSRSSVSTAIRATDVDFPFEDDGTFSGKTGRVYKFRVQKPVVALIEAELAAGNEDKSVQCRLYKLEAETSFSLEYYMGQVSGDRCFMRVALGNGDYQLEITPRGGESMGFEVKTRSVTGDGNDGFREASLLVKGTPKTGNIESDDYAEWYTFKVTKPGTYTVQLTNAQDLHCLIYPMSDVDLYGFSGPVCNEAYEMPVGTYYVGVMKRDHHEDAESFTVQFK